MQDKGKEKGKEGGVNYCKMFMGICPYLIHLPQNSSCRELGERRDHRILTGKKRPTQIHSLSYTTVERR